MNITPAEVIGKMLDGWKGEHWYQGGAVDPTGTKWCMLGRLSERFHLQRMAFNTATEEYFLRFSADKAQDIVKEVIKEQYPDRCYIGVNTTALPDIAHFNDHPDTTFEDVTRVLEKALVRASEIIE